MNLAPPSLKVVSCAFQLWLNLRMLLPKRRCQTFNIQSSPDLPRIEKIYVINLDREPNRWTKMQNELRRILDSSGHQLLELTERYVAVDANAFLEDPSKDADIDPFYTLGDQLYVEPQPLALPTKFELNNPIRMSRAEIAVARSHINVWRRVAASNHTYTVILEDDVWFHSGFEKNLDQVWNEVMGEYKSGKFDVLYLSYVEAKHGAPKTFLSNNVFRPLRGLWHLSGYILSREGAEKLLRMLPCRGPIDLWINQHFEALDVRAVKQSIVSQRRNAKSSNSYSILPALTTIGAINSEEASLFNIRPIEQPVFAFGPEGSGHSSLSMALSMLGYRCCSDLETLPTLEQELLLKGKEGRVFNAYVNIGSLGSKVGYLRELYPKAKFILTANKNFAEINSFIKFEDNLIGVDIVVLQEDEPNKWQVICEHLRCAPPSSSFPKLKDLGQRPTRQNKGGMSLLPKCKVTKWDKSPWVINSSNLWDGIHSDEPDDPQNSVVKLDRGYDFLESFDSKNWLLRNDTFMDNLALFRPSNVEIKSGIGAVLSVRRESLGVREYSAAAICSRDQYLFGKFEATIQASNVPGVVTGFFLHRNSPRQEIDIEIAGNRPDRLIVNVFYNPGGEGAKFDYGYRGSPSYIDLGFDASKASHRFTIEWSPREILWRVDGKIVHKRVIWNPTPIPHLPMTLHVNCWPTRSSQLAGRINKPRLPATTILESIVVKANAGTFKPESDANDFHHDKTEVSLVELLGQ
jgi:GR25 family glycosyltransferase involved in LPS biosynthesis